MSRAWVLLAALGAFLAGYGYLKVVHDPALRAQAQLQRSTDSLQTVLDSLRSHEAQRATQDTTLAQIVVRTRLQVDTVVVQVAVAESVFVRELPDSLKAPFLVVEAWKDSVIAGLQLIVVSQAQQLALREASLQETRAALAAALTNAAAWERQARPPFFSRLVRGLPQLAAGLVLGVVLRTL